MADDGFGKISCENYESITAKGRGSRHSKTIMADTVSGLTVPLHIVP